MVCQKLENWVHTLLLSLFSIIESKKKKKKIHVLWTVSPSVFSLNMGTMPGDMAKMHTPLSYNIKYLRGESKKFVDFVNKIKSTYAISLKLPYVCDQFNTNKHRKFQTNRLINVVSMAICLMRVSTTRSTPRR